MATLVEIIMKHLLEEMRKNSEVEFKRNHLAERFKCVPSQINYVLETKFKNNEGFVVEIVRGSAGCVRIRRAGQQAFDGFGLFLAEAEASGKISSETARFMASGIQAVQDPAERERVIEAWFNIIKGESK